jgi:hypothetical protein
MDRSDRYRRFARECLELARTALSERSKATLLQMAHVHPDYSDSGYLQAVDAAFNNWEAMQKAGR